MENTPQIFEKQVITHSKALYPFAYNLTKNVDDAQDLIQETMYRSLVNKEKFAEGTNLRAWLFTIMRNIFINNYRKNSKRQIVSDNTENQIIINNHSRTVGNIGETNLIKQYWLDKIGERNLVKKNICKTKLINRNW